MVVSALGAIKPCVVFAVLQDLTKNALNNTGVPANIARIYGKGEAVPDRGDKAENSIVHW